ncbi:tetratricopeptide repeat-containing sulfotransferase family protein [Steroidobacter sp.]|uniref:tetratricopeptide repeat-containing sulfotransferase family protein n=1 Tax=Steroidobacter sp. TaxID=1978227 RepID=UPI001A3809BA|nr:tetratricopeptide repeat-containing sulfotransferase family protein [Steroidobacter sp.]MBL8267758.1 sulfotransferase [Steroidobacter sp.]
MPQQPLPLSRADADRLVEEALRQQHQAGNLAGAYQTYSSVLRVYPDHAPATHYLGLVAQQSGDTPTAIALLKRALRLNPLDATAHNHLGQLFMMLKRVPEALQHFEAAVSAAPTHVDSLNSLANALKTTGDLRRATTLYRQALAQNPASPHASYNLANVLKDQQLFDEAQLWYERALAATPDHLPAHHNLALLLEQKGQFSEAAAHYRRVLQLNPNHAKALANLLAIRSLDPDAEVLARAQTLARDASVGDQDRIVLHHGLGKYFDHRQEYDIAFGHFDAANSLQRQKRRAFDIAETIAYVDELIETFSADYFAATAGGGDPSQRPIFIVGMPRSGTTLTEQILAAHPDVFAAGELQGIPAIARTLHPNYPAAVATLPASARTDLARTYLAKLEELAPAGARRVTDKLPVNFMQLGLIATLFPNARVVHCRRNPLDVGLSCYMELFQMRQDFTADLEHFGQYFLQYERLMAHWRRVLPLPMIEQTYEELVVSPESHIRALVAHCGLEWNAACLDFHQAERAVLTPSRWQVRQPMYRSAAGKWRRYEKHLAPLIRTLTQASPLHAIQ